MNKKTLTYVGIGLVVVVGGYLLYDKFLKKTESTESETPESETPQLGKSDSISDKKLKRFGGLKDAISESAKALETSDKEMVSEVSEAKRRGILGERTLDTSVDPRLAEAVAIRDEADKIRKAKGIRDGRWFFELQGQKLKLSVQAFMLYKQSNASTQEKLDGAKTMLQWAKSR
jgi:hypothetical protein